MANRLIEYAAVPEAKSALDKFTIGVGQRTWRAAQ